MGNDTAILHDTLIWKSKLGRVVRSIISWRDRTCGTKLATSCRSLSVLGLRWLMFPHLIRYIFGSWTCSSGKSQAHHRNHDVSTDHHASAIFVRLDQPECFLSATTYNEQPRRSIHLPQLYLDFRTFILKNRESGCGLAPWLASCTLG